MLRQNSYLTASPGGNGYRNRKPPKSEPSVPSNHPDWKSAYDNILRETDTSKVFKLMEIAEPAMLTRLDALAGGPNHHVERQALEDALYSLKFLKIDRLKFGRV